MEDQKSFYNKWSPSPKKKSLLAERAEKDQPLFLRGLAGPPSPKAGKPVKEAKPAKPAKPAKGEERAWNHAEPKQIIRTFTY
jgi:hypothetical protein